jgi:cyclic pyranopterin phosphate synthase
MADILTYEEIYTITRAAAELGITKVRLTGGEPLVRLGLPDLVRMLAGIKEINDISLTTNGLLLARYAAELAQAGLHRVNVSLDTLQPDRFCQISRRQYELGDVLRGIEAARAAGINPVKVNMVVMAGVNDDEILDFAHKTITEGWHVRFIELMLPAGVSTTEAQFIPAKEMKQRLWAIGKMEACRPESGNGPASYFRFPGARGTVGFITPVSEHFCFQCNRLRLTSDGKLRPCLMAEEEIDLRTPLRTGASIEELKSLIKEAVALKPLRHHLAEGEVPRDRPFSQVGG